MVAIAAGLLALAFVFSGLEAAWAALDRVRLHYRAARSEGRAVDMLAWDSVSPQVDLVMMWTSRVAAAAAFVLFAYELSLFDAPAWLAPVVFVPVYALVVQLLARQVFRRLPFKVLSKLWWLVSLAGSFWALLARPAAALFRLVKPEPLSRAPAAQELVAVAESAPEISPLELGMLRSVLDFRRFTAGGLARPPESFPHAPADTTLAELLAQHAELERRNLGRGLRNGDEFLRGRGARKRLGLHVAQERRDGTSQQQPKRSGQRNKPPQLAQHFERQTAEDLAGEKLHHERVDRNK
ncbi:MAG: hypothetical protein ACKOEI_01500, partial [Chthoniobacterales bacterium]